MKWQFKDSEWERIDFQRITSAGAYKLLRKVIQSGLFPAARVAPHEDEAGFCVVVRDPDDPRLEKALYNMQHLKILCLRNQINLRIKLLKNAHLKIPVQKKGFKTQGRKRKNETKKDIKKEVEDISHMF